MGEIYRSKSEENRLMYYHFIHMELYYQNEKRRKDQTYEGSIKTIPKRLFKGKDSKNLESK
jgi:hypothetical protein